MLVDQFARTARTRVRRLPKRGHYDRDTVHAVLDAGVLCHVGYVIDDQPYVTPTCHWRHGDRLYWHGSSASRMLRHLKQGVPACVTVTHLDGFVLARSGFHHSVNYRSVMALGQARLVPDESPPQRGQHRHRHHRGHEPGGDLVGQALDGRAAPLRLPDHANDLRQQRVGADPVRAHD